LGYYYKYTPKGVLFIGTGVARAVGPSVMTSSTDFSFQNLVLKNLFEFLAAKNHFKINISHIL
jgi:6-phosphogluconate dehydrogenase